MFWEGITPSAPTWFRGSGISAFYPIEDSETIILSSHISRLHAYIHTYIHPYKYIQTDTKRQLSYILTLKSVGKINQTPCKIWRIFALKAYFTEVRQK